MKTLATYSIKGGVGKTTSAVNLAYEAGTGGFRVLIWDLDPQGAATYFCRVEARVEGGSRKLVGAKGSLAAHVRATDVPAVHLLPADFSLRHLDLHLDGTKRPLDRLSTLLDDLSDRYDVAILDCPPSISLASESVFSAADALLVPVIPTTLSYRTLEQLVRFLDGRDGAPLVLPYFSMVDSRKRLHRDLVAALRRDWPAFLPTSLPSTAVVERMGVERSPVGSFAASTPAARAFAALWQDVAARLWP